MIEPIDDIAKDAIDFLQDQQNHRLDLKPMLFNFAIDSICRVFFGILTKCHRNENQDIIDLANKVLDQYKMKTYFDDLKYHCPGIFPTQHWNQAAKVFANMTKDIIDQRVDKVGDFIDRLKKMKSEHFNEKLVYAQSMMFITSAYEISSALGTLIWYLSTHQDVQELIVQEICMYEQSFNLKTLRYLEACIHETLRICPPVLCQYRHCIQDCIVNGIEIKKETNVQLAIQASHWDPEYFSEPEKFKPERFLRLKPLIKPFTYRPFGCGYRCSIGQQFTIKIMKLYMVNFLKVFQVKSVGKPLTFEPGYLNFLHHPHILVELEPRMDFDLRQKYSWHYIERKKTLKKVSLLCKKMSLRKKSVVQKVSQRKVSLANVPHRVRKVGFMK